MSHYLSKLIVAAVLAVLGVTTSIGQISYQGSYHSAEGNPGGLNTEQDFDNSGWSVLMLGGISSNQWSPAMSLPFTFNFFGQNFNTYRVSANGLMTFGSGTGGLLGDNNSLPSFSLPDYTIACHWDQFTTSPPLPLNDVVQTKVFGSAPDRQIWIRWASYEWSSANFVYLAIVLEETTGNIYMVDQYSSPSSTSLTTTVGVQKTSGFAVQAGNSIGLTGATSAYFDNSYYQFEPYPIPPEDITPVEILAPTAESCGLSGDAVSIRIQNQGQLSASTIQVGYALDGVVQATETIIGPLSPGASMAYTFSQLLTYPQGGEYELTVWGTTTGDGDNSNDSLSTNLVRYQQVSSYPYQEDFENGAGGWTTGGSKTSWELANPAKTSIQSAASGTHAWVTNATSSYQTFENGYVESPCFDFSQLSSQSTFSMWVWWESESPWDGAALMSTTDGGQSWQVVGSVDLDWYNSGFVASLPGGQALGWSGRQATGNGSNGWRQVSLPIPSTLRGQSQVRFRMVFVSNGSVQSDGFAFDKITIGDAPQVNLGNDGFYCPGAILDADNPGLAYLWSDGSTAKTITLENNTGSTISDSVISVTVTNSLGLSTTDSLTWSMAVPMQSQVTSVVPVTCYGQGNGQILTQIQGGTPPFLYLWSNGGTETTPANLTPGWYSATVTDLHGCTVEVASTEITQPTALTISSEVHDVNCFGASTGTIDLSAQGGNGGYEWEWDDAITGASRQQLAAGSYRVTLRDNKGCSLSKNFEITQNDSIAVSLVSQEDAGCPNDPDGRLYIDVEGGREPYLISWSHGPNGFIATGLTPGTYHATVADSFGCEVISQSWEIAYTDSAPSAGFGYELEKDVLTMQDSSSGASSYNWDFGDGSTSTLPNPIYQYGDTGRFLITLIAANDCGEDTSSTEIWITQTDTTVIIDPGDTTVNDTSNQDTSTTGIFLGDQAEDGFELFPNPNSGTFTIRLGSTWELTDPWIRVYSSTGQLVMEKRLPLSESETQIVLPSQLPPGYYKVWVINHRSRYGKGMLIR